MSDVRQRYNRWTREQLLEHAISQHRDLEADRHHRAAIKRDLKRAEALQSASVSEIDAKLGAPVLRDLLWVLSDIIEASDPLSSTPAENTMRVTNPSSSADEGAPTRRYRKLRKVARYRVERVTEGLRDDLNRDQDSEALSYINRQNQLSRWHKAGKHGEPVQDCPRCEGAEAS